MAYAQIASASFTYSREDGTDKTYSFVVEKRDAVTDTLDIPIVGNWQIIQGSNSDGLFKGVKTHELLLQIKESAGLVDDIISAGPLELYVKVTETGSGTVEFEGFVKPGEFDWSMFKTTKTLEFSSTGIFSSLAAKAVDKNTRFSLYDYLKDTTQKMSSEKLDRSIDFYTSWKHEGDASTDFLPENIRFDEPYLYANNRLEALSRMLSGWGWGLFQRNGRLVAADRWDQSNSPGAIEKLTDDGTGTYSRSTANVLLSLGDADMEIWPKVRRRFTISEITQQFVMNTRNRSAVAISSILNQNILTAGPANKITESTSSQALGTELLRFIEASGYLEAKDTVSGVTSGTFHYMRVKADNQANGQTIYLDPATGAWSSTDKTFNMAFSFDTANERAHWNHDGLEADALPDGFVGHITVEALYEIDYDANSALEDDHAHITAIDSAISLVGQDPVTYKKSQASAGEDADTKVFNHWLDDRDDYTIEQTYYDIANRTTGWIDGGDGVTIRRYSEESARRKAALLLGNPYEVRFRVRDLTRIDLLNVLDINDNTQIKRYIPLQIIHTPNKGWYDVIAFVSYDNAHTITNVYQNYEEKAVNPDTIANSARGEQSEGTTTPNAPATTSVEWGEIGGVLGNQNDLQSALDGKSDVGHVHAASDITTGTFADARIAQTNVTQHEAALTIQWGQITGTKNADQLQGYAAADFVRSLTFTRGAQAGSQTITHGGEVGFQQGSNVTISMDTATANKVVYTINASTGPNNYVDGGSFYPSGLNLTGPELILTRNGLSELSYDMTGLDSRYAGSSHTHSFFDLSDTAASASAGQYIKYDGTTVYGVTETNMESFKIGNGSVWETVDDADTVSISAGSNIDSVNVSKTGDHTTLTINATTQSGGKFIDGLTWDGATGVITASRSDGMNFSADIDGRYLQLGGGTMTGNLQISPSSGEGQIDIRSSNDNADLVLDADYNALATGYNRDPRIYFNQGGATKSILRRDTATNELILSGTYNGNGINLSQGGIIKAFRDQADGRYGYIALYDSTNTRGAYLGYGNGSGAVWLNIDGTYLNVRGSGSSTLRVEGNTVWHAGNLSSPMNNLNFNGNSFGDNDDISFVGGTNVTISTSVNAGSSIQYTINASSSGGVVDELTDDAGNPVSKASIQLTGSGTISTTTNPGGIDISNSSDRRMKDNIRLISTDEVYDRFMKLQTRGFTWRRDLAGDRNYMTTNDESMGQIGQEFCEQFPELTTLSPSTQLDGGKYGIDYSAYAGSVLTVMLQHAIRKIESLEQEIEALKAA